MVTIEVPFIEYLYNAATFSNGNGREKIMTLWLANVEFYLVQLTQCIIVKTY